MPLFFYIYVKRPLHDCCQLYIVEYSTADRDSKVSFTIIQQTSA